MFYKQNYVLVCFLTFQYLIIVKRLLTNIYWAFQHIFSYNIENWVWTRTLASPCCMLQVLLLHRRSLIFSYDCPQQRCHIADIEIR